MTETLSALRDMENKLDEMDEAMAAMKLIFEASATENRDEEKGD